ncbi:conserved hypothetical protein [Ricinus communis]|uniref:Uncharacterized protein n=1 Tax=Ricinus communis TaxID=3988 RepID=B9S894_RICCO|nr:conserved hypothetical protein [Ricinus communis]
MDQAMFVATTTEILVRFASLGITQLTNVEDGIIQDKTTLPIQTIMELQILTKQTLLTHQ